MFSAGKRNREESASPPRDLAEPSQKKPKPLSSKGRFSGERYNRYYFEKQERRLLNEEQSNEEGLDTGERDGLESDGIFAREESKWLTRIMTAINKLQVTKIRKCTPRIQWTAEQLDPRQFSEMILEDLLTNASPQPGRNFVKHEVKVTRQCVAFLVKDSVTGNIRRLTLSLVHEDKLSSAEKDNFCADFATMINNFPGTIDMISSESNAKGKPGTVAKWAVEALLSRYGITERSLPAIAIHGSDYEANIRVFDPSQNRDILHQFRVQSKASADHIPDFELPSGLKFRKGYNEYWAETQIRPGYSSYESMFADDSSPSDTDLKSRRMIEKIIRLTIFRLHGSVLSHHHLRHELTKIARDLATTRLRVCSGIYDGTPLFQAYMDPPHTDIRLANKAATDITGKFPVLRLRSLDRYRAQLCIRDGEAAFEKTSDLLKAAIALATSVDQQNRQIREGIPVRPMSLSAEQKKYSYTPCGGCAQIILWSTAQTGHNGFPCCDKCIRNEKGRLKISLAHLLKSRSRACVKRDFSDIKKVNRVCKSVNDLIDKEFSRPQLRIAEGKRMRWLDGYCAKVRHGKEYVPRHMTPSIEAVLPYVLDAAGDIGIHVAENLLPFTTWAMNSLKHTQLPKFLLILAKHTKAIASAIEQPNYAKAVGKIQRQFIRDAHRLAVVRKKFAYSRTARLASKTTLEEYRYDLEQMRTGLLRPGDEDPPIDHTMHQVRHRNQFDCNTLKRIKAVQQDILDIFPVGFPRGEDGTLFFSYKEAMPCDWDLQSLYSLAASRLARVDEYCNWDEDTEDEPETICHEIFFQQAVRFSDLKDSAELSKAGRLALKRRYREFLNLPIVLETRNACMLSIGHSEHGAPMLSGWKLSPMSLKDRNDSKNNLLVETQASNFYKLDHPQKYYEQMYWRVTEIKMPRKWVDVTTTKLEEGDSRLAANISTVKEEDAMDFEAYTGVVVAEQTENQDESEGEKEQEE